MGLEGHAFLTDLTSWRQAENLIAAAVGKQRPVPVHEPVQPANRLYEISPRPQPEMVSVGKYYPGAKGVQILRS